MESQSKEADISNRAKSPSKEDDGAVGNLGNDPPLTEELETSTEISGNTKKPLKTHTGHKDTNMDGADQTDDDNPAGEDGTTEEGSASEPEDDSSLSPDSTMRKAKPLLESVKKTLTAAAISAAQKTDDMSGIGGGKSAPKSVAPSGCTPSPNKSVLSKGTSATPTKSTPTPTKGASGSGNAPLVYKSPFLCSCGRNFDTKRGLSIHMSSNESHHIAVDAGSTASELPPAKNEEDQSFQDDGSCDKSSSALSPTETCTAGNSGSSPSSPTHFNMATFKTSTRNPHYYSIIRTRRSSGIEGDAAEPPQAKRPHAGGSSNQSVASPSPAKGSGKPLEGKKLQQSSGGQSGSSSSDANLQSEPKSKRKLRESSEQKASVPQKSAEESRTTSASPSLPSSKKLSSSSTANSGSTSVGNTSSGSLVSTLQELGLRSSPITRSNAASLKTPHEFISLPTRSKRGKKGPWKGGFKKEGSKQDSDDNMSDGAGEEFESPSEPTRSSQKDTIRSSTRKESARSTSSDVAASTASGPSAGTSKNQESSDESSQQPQKRKRGRPPKTRNSAPSTPQHEGTAATKASPASSGNVTRSGKLQNRVGAGKAREEEVDSEPAEESPLPMKSKSTSVSGNKESAKKSGEKGKGSKGALSETESVSNKQKKDGSKVSSSEMSSGKKGDTTPSKSILGKRLPISDEKSDSISKKRQKKRKPSVGSTRAAKIKREVEEEEEEAKEEEEEEDEEESEAEKEEQAEAVSEDDPDNEEEAEEDKNDNKKRTSKKTAETAQPTVSKTRSRAKGGKAAPKSKATTRSSKGKTKRKSQVEAEEPDTDVSMDTDSKPAATTEEGAGEKQVKEESEEVSTPPVDKMAASQQRQSSVIVSVLSGSAEKPQQQQQHAIPTSSGQSQPQAAEQSAGDGNSENSASKDAPGTAAVVATGPAGEKEIHPPDQPQPAAAQQQQMFYPTSSPTTPTYGPFPYPTSFPPAHHPMMYHPNAPGHPPGMYPQFYPYPGSQPPMQMPPHPNQFLPPPQPPMAVTSHPAVTQPASNAEQQQPGGSASPHGNGIPGQNQAHPQQQQQQATTQPQTGAPSSFASQPPQSSAAAAATTSGAIVGPPAATTVGGVRVSVVNDKLSNRMPMVSLPYHMPSATPPRGPRPLPAGPGGYPPMEIPPGMRPYIPGPGTPQSPEGMESHPVMHPPHPLTQVYRPMMTSYHPQAHIHPQYGPPMAIRVDHMGPYLDWPHEPRPPPAEESPAQPVKCPECNRMFKNNKALNGHMRLHGGFDWSKKHPYNPSNSSNNANSGDSKQSSSGTSGGGSSASTNSPNDESKQTSGPSSSKTRKRSHSNSRSRSNSPNPSVSGKGKGSKRRKSAAEDNATNSQSGLAKDSRSSGGVSEASGATNSAAAVEALASLPVPREPSIFTFDSSNTHISSSSQKSLTSSMSSQTSESTMQGGGAGGGGFLHRGSTLDDLCRAAAELERIDTNVTSKMGGDGNSTEGSVEDEFGRKRPGNIVIPQTQSSSPAIDRLQKQSTTPPYTPPPILSPTRSIMQHLAPGVVPVNPSAPCTPNRILTHIQWNSRRSNDGRTMSETEDTLTYTEPRINVGEKFQAKLPDYDEVRTKVTEDNHRASLVWKPFDDMTPEDECVIEGYLELACSPSVGHGGRNKELALHYLHTLNGSVKEAVKWLMSGRSMYDANSPMADYNYSGSNRWSGRERQQFRRTWKCNRKDFDFMNSAVESKKFTDIIEYYYTWKKYCSDEYRGRNRHISEEIFSDEDEIYAQIPSSSSSGSGDSSELGQSMDENNRASFKSARNGKKNGEKLGGNFSSGHGQGGIGTGPNGTNGYRTANSAHSSTSSVQGKVSSQANLPVVYAPHTSPVPVSQQIHQFPCKYPGCNQVFTSIFALNGHIRIHGGSFYPKASSQPPSSNHHHHHGSGYGNFNSTSRPQQQSHSNSSSFSGSSQLKGLATSGAKSLVEIELAKTLLELPGGGQSCGSPSSSTSSIAKSMRYHTPSPKPSPGKMKSAAAKKKMASSSPGEREDHYPCNKCGRVFTKVKSRSAHMKSHIPKAT